MLNNVSTSLEYELGPASEYDIKMEILDVS
jgi:hypothetical protein